MVTIFFVNRYSSSKSAYSVSTQTQQPYNLKKWRMSLIQSIIYISHVTYDVIIKKVCLRGSWEGEDQSNILRVWRVSVHKQSTRKKQKDTLKPDQKKWTRTSLKETREKQGFDLELKKYQYQTTSDKARWNEMNISRASHKC